MKKIKKIIYILLIQIFLLFTFSCSDDIKKVSSIKVSNISEVSVLEENNFKLSDIEITFMYDDGSTEIKGLTNEMLSEDDLQKFEEIGKHQVYIFFEKIYTTFDFEVIRIYKDISYATITVDGKDTNSYVYSGFPITPKIELTLNDKVLIENEDYTVNIINNRNCGKAVIELKGINDYNGSAIKTFEITKRDLTISVLDHKIVGKEKPSYEINYNGLSLADTKDDLKGTLNIECDYDQNKSGVYEIKLSGLSSDNYNIKYQSGYLTVECIAIDGEEIVIYGDEFIYTGKEITPSISVIVNGKEISSYNYKVEYIDNINAGVATVKVEGIDAYTGEIIKTFEIKKANLTVKAKDKKIIYKNLMPIFDCEINGFVNFEDKNVLTGKLEFTNDYDGKTGTYKIIPSGLDSSNYQIEYINGVLTVEKALLNTIVIDTLSAEYKGVEIKPKVTVTSGNNVLTENTEYIVSYKNNINSGVATVYVEGVGNFTGALSKEFTITKKQIEVKVEDKTVYYLDKIDDFNLQIKGLVNGETVDNLDGRVEYVTTYKQDSNIGTYRVRPTGLQSNNYKIIFTDGIVTVERKDINQLNIKYEDNNFIYNGKEQSLSFTITNGDTYLRLNTDYKVTYKNNVNATTSTLSIIGINNYDGNIIKEYQINKKDLFISLNDVNITFGDELFELVPKIEGFVNGENTDVLEGELTVTTNYKKYSEIGKYQINISEVESPNYNIIYTNAYVNVLPKELNKNMYVKDTNSYTYNGLNITPNVQMFYNDYNLKETDYIITYTDNINSGVGKIKITGKNNFKGEIIDTFTINKKDITIKINDQTIKYLDKVNNFDYEVIGLEYQNDLSLIEENIKLYTNYKQGDTEGKYEINAHSITLDNYNVTISKAYITLLYEQIKGEGTKNAPYKLSSPNDLMMLSKNPSLYNDKYFVLTNDIDFSGFNFYVIGDDKNPLTINLDGNNFKIKNTHILNGKSIYGGLFANILDSNISNLIIEDVIISDNNIFTYCGILSGIIQNSIIDNVSIRNCKINEYSNTTFGCLSGKIQNSNISNIYLDVLVNIENNNSKYGSIAFESSNTIYDSIYINSSLNLVTDNKSYIFTNALNQSQLNNIILTGYMNIYSQSVVALQNDTTYISDLYVLSSSNIYVNDELLNITYTDDLTAISIFLDAADFNKWSYNLDDVKLSIDDSLVKYVKPVAIIEKEYDNKYYEANGFVIVDNYKDAGEYVVTLNLKDGFIWSDGTKDDRACKLVIKKKPLYITIDNIRINSMQDVDYTYRYDGLLLDEVILLNNITITSDYDMTSGEYEIYAIYDNLNNYDVKVVNGKLYVDVEISVWDGKSVSEMLSGEGSDTSPYLITSANDLAYLSYIVNNNINSKEIYQTKDKYYKLMTNIDLNNHAWVPIGYELATYGFSGIFDFNGYTISNVAINKSYTYTGLFGYVIGGVILNARLDNVNISTNVFDSYNVGLLCGRGENMTIEKSQIQGKIIIKSYCNQNINAGGIVGYLKDSTILYSTVNLYLQIDSLDKRLNDNIINVGALIGFASLCSCIQSHTSSQIYVNDSVIKTNVCGGMGVINGGSLENCLLYNDIFVFGNLVTVNHIVPSGSNISIDSSYYLDSNVIVLNDVELESIDEYKKSYEEIENLIYTLFDNSIFDLSTIYPKLK